MILLLLLLLLCTVKVAGYTLLGVVDLLRCVELSSPFFLKEQAGRCISLFIIHNVYMIFIESCGTSESKDNDGTCSTSCCLEGNIQIGHFKISMTFMLTIQQVINFQSGPRPNRVSSHISLKQNVAHTDFFFKMTLPVGPFARCGHNIKKTAVLEYLFLCLLLSLETLLPTACNGQQSLLRVHTHTHMSM